MDSRRWFTAFSARSLIVGAVLCLWLFTQGLAAAHSHDGVQLHAECATCHIGQAESLPGTSFPATTASPTRDHDTHALPETPALKAFTRYYSPRAPPQLS